MSRKRSQAIRDFLEGELHYAELTTPERQYFRALKLAESMMLDGKTDRAIRAALFEKYEMKRRTAQRALEDVQLVFGDTRKVDRNWQRYRAEQMSLKIYEKAEREDNLAGMLKAVKLYIEANGLNNDDPDLPVFEDVQAAVNVMMLPEGMEDLILQQLRAGVVDHTRAPGQTHNPTEDVEYVILEPGSGTAAEG